MDLTDKHVLITGASQGIGKETAHQLITRGARVLITGRNPHKLEQAARDTGAIAMRFDMSDTTHMATHAARCLTALDNRIDVLINNAGARHHGEIEQITWEDLLRVYQVNVFGLTLLTREMVPVMKRQQSGTIINIGSTCVRRGYTGGSIYGSSKLALRALTQSWQSELRPHGIRVTQINPGWTRFTTRATADGTPRELRPEHLSTREIAHAIVSVLEMDQRGFVDELNVWPTRP